MTSRLGDTRTWVTGTVAFDSTADIGVFTPCRPIVLRRWGYIWNAGTVTVPETLDIDIDKRILIGSDTGRLTGATKLATLAGVAGEAQGKGRYETFTKGSGDVIIAADEEVVVEVQAAATAGDGVVFIEYEELPFSGDHNTYIGANLVDNDA